MQTEDICLEIQGITHAQDVARIWDTLSERFYSPNRTIDDNVLIGDAIASVASWRCFAVGPIYLRDSWAKQRI